MTNDIQPPRIYPTYRYNDAAAMFDWLQHAFGFKARAKHMDGNKIAHAQLMLGSSIVMLGDVRDDNFGKMVGVPGESGGKATYIAVEDVDAIYKRAKAADAEVLEEPHDRDHGSRDFICRDPEGNVWCFGTYWPKAHEAAK